MIVFVFSEIIPHRTKILSWSYSNIVVPVSSVCAIRPGPWVWYQKLILILSLFVSLPILRLFEWVEAENPLAADFGWRAAESFMTLFVLFSNTPQDSVPCFQYTTLLTPLDATRPNIFTQIFARANMPTNILTYIHMTCYPNKSIRTWKSFYQNMHFKTKTCISRSLHSKRVLQSM